MAGYRIPGPICVERQPWSIKDGTFALTLTPPPGPVCAYSPLFPTIFLLSLPARTTTPDLRFLFSQCLNPETGLSEADYSASAKVLGVEAASIKAVAEVETAGSAFDDSGRPRILFERHIFHALTAGKYDAKHAVVSNKKPGATVSFPPNTGSWNRLTSLTRMRRCGRHPGADSRSWAPIFSRRDSLR